MDSTKKNYLKEAIKKKFLILAGEQGFENVRLKNLTQEMKISRTTFYCYYGNKDELLNEIISELVSDLKKTKCHLSVVKKLNSNSKSKVYNCDYKKIADYKEFTEYIDSNRYIIEPIVSDAYMKDIFVIKIRNALNDDDLLINKKTEEKKYAIYIISSLLINTIKVIIESKSEEYKKYYLDKTFQMIDVLLS
ncbi:MAG: TetR/AcrR family transcriptional regulator [Clostridioides sp.]|jgi:hypothetical protein|nr:TetR/AcrR family transcriptional regulator [Clostridioides sp.]